MTAAAWHPDPTGKHELRYWDGSQWTEHVADAGVQSTDPLVAPGGSHAAEQTDEGAASEQADELTGEQAAEQPAATEPDAEPEAEREPSAEASAEQPAAAAEAEADPATEPLAAQPMPQQPPQYTPQQPPQYTPQQGSGPAQPAGGASYGGGPAVTPGISGDLIDGRYGETTSNTPGPSLQNNRLLRVRVTEPFMARQGSMVAYQGNVNFAYQGSGAAKFLKKALTGEGLSLMRVEGQGDAFFADAAHHVHILHLTNSGISVNGASVLAFSGSLQYDIERVKGGSMAAGGLFNTSLRGTGWVAITTDGEPVVLNAAEAPTFADANALVAWSIDLQTNIKSSMTAGALIGRGSGEAFQVAFHGQGFVIIQPSEGAQVPPHTH